jgi:hypothetical protein
MFPVLFVRPHRIIGLDVSSLGPRWSLVRQMDLLHPHASQQSRYGQSYLDPEDDVQGLRVGVHGESACSRIELGDGRSRVAYPCDDLVDVHQRVS